MRRVLVVIEADPHATERALEGLRMGVGLTLAENRVTVLLAGDGKRLLDPEREAFGDWPRAREYLDALRQQGVEVQAGGSALRAGRKADVVIRWEA